MRLRRAVTCISAARIALDAGHLLEAEERLEEACLLDPEGLEARILLEQLRSREPDEAEEPALALPEVDAQGSGAVRRWSHWVAVLIAVVALAALAWWRAPSPDESRIVPAQRPAEPRSEPGPDLPRTVDLQPDGGTEVWPEGHVDLLGIGQQVLAEPGEPVAAPSPAGVATSGQLASAGPSREVARPPASLPSAPASPSALTAGSSARPTPIAAPPPVAAGIPGGAEPSPAPPSGEPAPFTAPLAGVAFSPPSTEPMPPPGDAAPAALRDVAADEEAISEVLGQYVDAYNRLDARAASRVWPTVDERALARAFAGLESQGITFEGCDLSVDDAEATAACRGRARHVPKVGERNPISHSRRWTFRLLRTDSGWQIMQAEAQ